MNTHRHLVGVSSTIHLVEQDIECAARSGAKVLITGETGVGKETVARLIHGRSRRAKQPLVRINCAGTPDSLLEAELFGHVRGSLTDAYRGKRGWLERTNGGTIFMDDVDEMSLHMQALLLRFLENGEVQRIGNEQVRPALNVGVIAATNRDLMTRIADKCFREELFYRLNVIHVTITPLRERAEDIPVLFDHFLRVCCERHGIDSPVVTSETLARLMAYHWPGNVREVKNVVERLVVVRTQSGVITPADLPREIRARGGRSCPSAGRASPDQPARSCSSA